MADVVGRFDIVIPDPLSAVAAVLGFDFDNRNAEFVEFYLRLVQPLTKAGVTVVMPDNIGHALEARNRAKGVSAKQDLVDLTFSCKVKAQPLGLTITATKVRSVRAPFKRGDRWTFDRETQRITAEADGDAGGFRPTELMSRVAEAIERTPGISKTSLRTNVHGRTKYVDDALARLVAEGYVKLRSEGAGKATEHYLVRPFEPDPDPLTDPVPTPCRSGSLETLTVRSPPKGDGQGRGSGSDTDPDPDAELDRLEAKGFIDREGKVA